MKDTKVVYHYCNVENVELFYRTSRQQIKSGHIAVAWFSEQQPHVPRSNPGTGGRFLISELLGYGLHGCLNRKSVPVMWRLQKKRY